MAVQHSVKENPQKVKLAITQQPAADTQTELVPGHLVTPPNQATAPVSIPFLSADNSTPKQIDVWQRIRNGYAMPEQDSKLVSSYGQWYAKRPDYFARMTDRGQRYLYFIVEEVEKRGMPMEIALLPMIESAFNPGAYSTASASGIWQFIPSTGKHFGMQQNWWYDGRRDVISATNGALDYLQKLHGMFGEWDLALAAYNCGENCVMRAQARNRKLNLPTNYASLKLPKETREYVPKLLAVKNLISFPENFSLVLTDIPNKPYFALVSTSRHIDLKLAAEMAGISVEEFTALNPAHNRPVILQKGKDVLLLPVDNVETFRANLERANQPLVSWQAYPARKGENLDKLASRFGIATEKLRSINSLSPHIKVSNGQTLLVPLNGEEAGIEFAAFNTNIAPTDQKLLSAARHTVRKGDTLSSIARRYQVQVASLQSLNKGVKTLRPGQYILVAQKTPVLQKARVSQRTQLSRATQAVSKSNRNIKRAASTAKNQKSTFKNVKAAPTQTSGMKHSKPML